MTTPLIGAKTCGNCAFAEFVKENVQLIECHGAPPTPVVMGMSPQGPAIGILWPRIARTTKACALFRQNDTANRVQTPAPLAAK